MDDTTIPLTASTGSTDQPAPAAGTTLYLRSTTLDAPRATPRAVQARRERLVEGVARRRLRLDATISLVRSRHLADAAQADPQLQGVLRRLIDFVHAPGRPPGPPAPPAEADAPAAVLSR